MNSKLLILMLAGAGATAAAAGWLRARRKTPEERERERRTRINEIGRITDGNVIDTQEIDADEQGNGQAQMVIYTYDVSGVTYEASQDITALRPRLDLRSSRIGLPASVKYDPKSPGNSIVISEAWSGLRIRKK